MPTPIAENSAHSLESYPIGDLWNQIPEIQPYDAPTLPPAETPSDKSWYTGNTDNGPDTWYNEVDNYSNKNNPVNDSRLEGEYRLVVATDHASEDDAELISSSILSGAAPEEILLETLDVIPAYFDYEVKEITRNVEGNIVEILLVDEANEKGVLVQYEGHITPVDADSVEHSFDVYGARFVQIDNFSYESGYQYSELPADSDPLYGREIDFLIGNPNHSVTVNSDGRNPGEELPGV